MFPGWSILGWKCGVYHGNKYALDNGILSMGKSMIFGFRVYDRSEDSRIYCHHLLEAPSLNPIALVTLELLHRPISENNIDYKGRVLLAANHNWRQHWKHSVENHACLGCFPHSSSSYPESCKSFLQIILPPELLDCCPQHLQSSPDCDCLFPE